MLHLRMSMTGRMTRSGRLMKLHGGEAGLRLATIVHFNCSTPFGRRFTMQSPNVETCWSVCTAGKPRSAVHTHAGARSVQLGHGSFVSDV
jgi:hypothetical protein